MKLPGILIIGFVCLISAPMVMAQQGQDVTIKTIPVNGNVYMLEGRGGNIGVSVGDDGILIIDDQFANLSDKIRAALGKLSEGKLEFVLNTHHHGDHTGSNAAFDEEAHIIAHKNVRKRLNQGDENADGLPVITFDSTMTMHFNGEEIRIRHLPTGHTDGDSIVHFTKSNVVHMGDHFFKDRFPYIDLGSGGDVAQFIENVKSVLATLPQDIKIIPGHGSLANRGDLKAFIEGVEESVEIIRKGIKDKKTLDELKAAGMPSAFDSWGSGFINTDRWIGIVHESLTR
jgi:glyoxylase-like metal-dependent hydrolase (beta-lactamase superfamily II)